MHNAVMKRARGSRRIESSALPSPLSLESEAAFYPVRNTIWGSTRMARRTGM